MTKAARYLHVAGPAKLSGTPPAESERQWVHGENDRRKRYHDRQRG